MQIGRERHEQLLCRPSVKRVTRREEKLREHARHDPVAGGRRTVVSITDARDEMPNVVAGMKKAAVRVGEMSDAGPRPGRSLLQISRFARCFEQPERGETHVGIVVQDPGRAELTPVPRVMQRVTDGHRVRHEGESSPCRFEPSRLVEHHGGLHERGDRKSKHAGSPDPDRHCPKR